MGFFRYDDYWVFCQHIRNPLQTVLSNHCREFLDALSSTLTERVANIKSGQLWWRAQRGHDLVDGVPVPYQRDRMFPDEKKVSEGRINTKGKAVLYLASDNETAMAEVRPTVGDLMSCGDFVIQKDLRIIDCRVFEKPGLYFNLNKPGDPMQPDDPDALNNLVWSHIDTSFSKPIGSEPFPGAYVPTQVLAEFFQEWGFDGVGYKSRLGPGFNLALFDLSCAKMERCSLFELRSTNHQFIPQSSY